MRNEILSALEKNSKLDTKELSVLLDKNEVEVKLKNQSMFRETVKSLKIIARASPEDKFLLVLGLK